MSTNEQPATGEYQPYLTVPQVQRLTQLSRTQVYRMIELYNETDGAEGIPSVRFGRCVRVPRHALLTGDSLAQALGGSSEP